MDESSKVSDFKTEHKKMYLFGVTRKLKENIYLWSWSPELFVHDGTRVNRIEVSLQTVRTSAQKIAKYLFPFEEAIVATALFDNKMYVLACHSLFTGQHYLLYEGDLNATNDIITNKRLLLDRKYTFPELLYKVDAPLTSGKFLFAGMSMYIEDDLVLFVGGHAVQPQVRFDIVLERKRQKFQMKYRRVRASEATLIGMSMLCPFTIREGKTLYFYSVAHLNGEWMLRIESADSTLEGCCVKQAPIKFYAPDYQKAKAGRVKGHLSSPYFSKIMKYEEFSSENFATWLEKFKLWLKASIRHSENEMQPENQQPEDGDKEVLPLLNDTLSIIKEAAKDKSFTAAKMEPLYECLRKFREKVRANQKLSSDAEMLGQLNALLNGIQKKEIEDYCLEGLPNVRRGDLYRFVL